MKIIVNYQTILSLNWFEDFENCHFEHASREKSYNNYSIKISQSLKKQAHFEMTHFFFSFAESSFDLSKLVVTKTSSNTI